MIRGALAAALATALPVAGGSAAPGDQATAGAAAMNPSAAASERQRRATARRLLALSDFRAREEALLEDSLEAAYAKVVEGCMNRAAAGQRVNCPEPSSATISEERREHMMDTITKAAVAIYAERFSVAEMEQIAGFFNSDIGRKYSVAYPPILARIQAIKRRLLIDELKSAPGRAASGGKP